METNLHSLEQVIIYSDENMIERGCPLIFACPLCPLPSCLSPFEQKNTYIVRYIEDNWEDEGQIIYEINEISSIFERFRFFCPPSRRSFQLEGQNRYQETVIKGTKPLKCAFFCLWRPELNVYYREQYIGKICEKFQYGIFICDFYELECYDKNNSLLYKIKASLCQCSIFCSCPCNSCRKNENIGQIRHIFGGWKQEWCSKADKFGIKFPENSTVEEKILLIMGSIFIDYAQFENY